MADDRPRRSDLPTGTVTFLRTDVEGSMGLARTLGARWDEVNATHLDLIRRAVDAHGGVCVRTEGDAFFGVFPEAGAAVAAAIDAQRALAGHDWPAGAPVRVRMGLHSGEAHLAGDDYGGFEVNRAARVAAAGHGGQVVLSEPTRLLAEAVLTDGVGVRDLGRHVLRDVPAPERLFQLEVPGLRTDFPPLRTSRPSAGNLPVRLTSFLGRDRELQELRDLLEPSRLVTLTGPGGIGKSSLAIELGRSLADTVPDGAWFVALDVVSDPAEVPAVIARTLGLFDGPERPAAAGLAQYLADRSALLVLDNFEQILEAATDVAALLRASPGTRIVVTSRAPLRIGGEQEYPVGPLGVGGIHREAVDLFVERARAVRPGWDPGSDQEALEGLCALLDGLPLGLELAAARVSLLPVGAIRDRLAGRMPLPGSGPRDLPARQRTLEGTIGWSYDLLEPGQQRLLQDLAVFEGGFDLEQAAQVAGAAASDTVDVIDGIGMLADQSLVARDAVSDSGAIRFRLLQTIRGFALGRLAASGREPEVRHRHALAYLALLREAQPHLPGADQPRWLDRLALDQDNLRAATRWSIDAGDVEVALWLIGAAWRFWQLDGHLLEAETFVHDALAMPGADAPTAARLAALAAAGGIAYWHSETRVAQGHYEAQLALAEQLGDAVAAADATFSLIFTRYIGGDTRGAIATIEDAERRFRELGDERGVARLMWNRATAVLQAGDPAGAVPMFDRSLEMFEATGDVWYRAMAEGSLAWAHWGLGDAETAGRWILRSLADSRAIRDTATLTISLPALAVFALENGHAEVAAAVLGAYENLRQVHGIEAPAGINFLIDSTKAIDRVRDGLGPDAYRAALERGKRMSLDEALDLVVSTAPAA